jgi:hypothetical protein
VPEKYVHVCVCICVNDLKLFRMIGEIGYSTEKSINEPCNELLQTLLMITEKNRNPYLHSIFIRLAGVILKSRKD